MGPSSRRTTRSSRGKLLSLSDPLHNAQKLDDQLRLLGLYAAPTLGDGNCLFRALSDQLYGSDTHHAQLRNLICDWIYCYKSIYEPFVDHERGIDAHLGSMRQNATYGGHMELSAFAHMTRCNVKVIQPGLVYVIEWHSFSLPHLPDSPLSHLHPDDTIYVAYHDWEHFSSIRNLKGPHVGRPNVKERPPPSDPPPPSPPPPKPHHRGRPQNLKIKLKLNASSSHKTGLTFRLPPPSSLSTRHSSSSSSSSSSSVDSNASPKRTFEQSELGDPSSPRSSRLRKDENTTPVDYESDSFSSLSSLDETTTTATTTTTTTTATASHDDLPIPSPRLTRRQRKRLGLPKIRNQHHYTPHEDEAEWKKNGTGRVDVRGFRELRI